MALKRDRREDVTEITYFMNTTAERGGIVCHNTGGSGAALDQSAAVVVAPANPSGYKPVGLLLNDVVDLDLTRQHLNPYKDEVQKGSKVCVMTKGWVVTNSIMPGISPAIGENAYVGNSGLLTNLQANVPNQPWVGRWKSLKDEDGYAKVEINLPAPNSTSQS